MDGEAPDFCFADYIYIKNLLDTLDKIGYIG